MKSYFQNRKKALAFEAPESRLGLPVDEETQSGEGEPGRERE